MSVAASDVVADATVIPPVSTARGPRAVRRVLAAILVGAIVAATMTTAHAADRGRLFRITKAGVPDSYVLGTIHIPDPRVATPSKPVLDALARCRTIAVELVPESGIDLQEFEQLEPGRSLDALIGADLMARLRARLGTRPRDEAPVRLKPWAALLRITSTKADAPGVAPLDIQVLVAARQRRMKVLPLELLDEQIAAFDTIPESTQVALLRDAINHPAALPAGVARTVGAWSAGDLDALARAAIHADDAAATAMRPHYEALVATMVHGRTALMHHRLFVPLREGRVFVAIGAMHLQGPKGLIALLREDGYRVSRVW